MKKEIKRFKTGKKKQHESAVSINIYTLSENPTPEEIREYGAVGGSNTSVKERLESVIRWVEKIMNKKATEMGLPDKFIINSGNAVNYGPLFVEAMSIRASASLALQLYEAEQFKEAFDLFQFAVPALLTLQYLRFEDQIKAGASRPSPGFKARAQEKEKLKALVKPIYDRFISDGKGKLSAGMLSASWLEREHQIKRSGKTIRDWFEVSPIK
jgi:hypothetical protein